MREYTIPMGRVNVLALTLILPQGIILGLPYFLIYGFDQFSLSAIRIGSLVSGTMLFFLILVFGAVIHEFLHGITWSLFTRKRWKAIRFGVKWEYLTPYCHCDEPLKKWQFVLGALMPFFIMGVLPVIASCFTGSFKLWFFGFFFSVAAGGDLICTWMLRKAKKNEWILDHPTELGFTVVDDGNVEKEQV
jgi:hypothetical protein